MKKKYACILGLALAAIVMAIVFAVDPSSTAARIMPKCAFHTITGWQCPGCGFTRGLHALLHGHLTEALRFNYFFIISIPLAIAVAFTTWSDSRLALRLKPIVQGRAVIFTYVALFFVWWVIRNILGV